MSTPTHSLTVVVRGDHEYISLQLKSFSISLSRPVPSACFLYSNVMDQWFQHKHNDEVAQVFLKISTRNDWKSFRSARKFSKLLVFVWNSCNLLRAPTACGCNVAKSIGSVELRVCETVKNQEKLARIYIHFFLFFSTLPSSSVVFRGN